MKRRATLLAASVLLLGAGVTAPSFAKDVSAEGQITAVADDGKSVTLKTSAGVELTVGVSSKRTRLTKGGARASRTDLASGNKASVVYDDEHPGNEAKSIDVGE